MVTFEAVVKKDIKNGEKAGWTYVEVPYEIAQIINPGVKTVYRVKGTIENVEIRQIALNPMGEGNYILPLNSQIRKKLPKIESKKLTISLEKETEELPLNIDLLSSIELEPVAQQLFESYSKSHKRYFSNWIETAKTRETKEKRIMMCLFALTNNMDFGQMIRHFKNKNDE